MKGPDGYYAAARRAVERHPATGAAVAAATRAFDARRARAYAAIDVEAWRRWAEGVKDHVLTRLDHHLEEAEARLTERGVTVHWASTAAEARTELAGIVDRHGLTRCVKGKSMLSEELGVEAALAACGVSVRETDLGEYIIQLLGEPPSHIVGPAIHRTLDDCRELFRRELGTPADASPELLAAAARRALREDFLAADLGLTGANFLVAETGSIVLIENEGNIRLSTSLPRVHVALVGVEKLLPRFADVAAFVQLTARAATGQPIGTYVSLLHGPRGAHEPDGPEHVHVILVDNGRTRLLAEPEAWKALRCLRCGACLNVCPVYRTTGGHPYGWAYSGPIGAVLAPGLLGVEAAHPLPYASTLCGACADVCPVRIPLPELLVHWRERSVAAGLAPPGERLAMRAYATAAERPSLFAAAARLVPAALRPPVARLLPVLRRWMAGRAAPAPSRASFRALWRKGID